tara:strand:- start:1880 stop:2023 length:144 start_codon:yes stop_codon:yes gene_type:complete
MEMYTHQPDEYDCPFCRFLAGDSEESASVIVYRDDRIACFPSKHWRD